MKNVNEINMSKFKKFQNAIESLFIPLGISSMLVWIAIFIIYPYINMFSSSIFVNGKYTL